MADTLPPMHWIEQLARDWSREFPELDTSALRSLTVLARLSLLLEQLQQAVLEPFELAASDYSVLATLRRAGKPYELNPSQLYIRLQRSSGGMAKMLKRLEERGLVRRAPDPEDGRASLIRLTARGLALQDRVFVAFVVASQDCLAALTAKERKHSEGGLRVLLEAFEAPGSGAEVRAE